MAGEFIQRGYVRNKYAVVTSASTGDLGNGPWKAAYFIYTPDEGELVVEKHFEQDFDTENEVRIFALNKAEEAVEEL